MRPRRLLTLAMVMSGLAWLGIALFAPAAPSTRLRRYVSAPLPDGSRYTFLYPERLHPEPQADGSLLLTRSFSAREWLATLWASGGRLPETRCESISVRRTPRDPTRGVGWRRVALHRRRGEPFRQFEAACNDERADRCDRLLYRWHQSQFALCAPGCLELLDSFQLLCPGENPPPDLAEDPPDDPDP